MQKTFETYHSSMSGLLFRTCRFLSKNQIGELPSTIFVNLTKLKALWVEMETFYY